MSDLVERAVMNNVLQGDAVLTALGEPGTFSDSLWINNHCLPIPYANAATIGPEGQQGTQLAVIEQFTTSRPADTPTFVMDSKASLDLTRLGYQIRIADEWFVRTSPVEPRVEPRAIPIETAADLAAFEAASVIGFGDEPQPDAGHIYAPALVDDQRFQFFGLPIDGALAAGVMLFTDPACTGIYTFFTLPQYRGQGLGTAILRHALSHAASPLLATNPSAMSRTIFKRLGFSPVGGRTIWMRPAPSGKHRN